MQQRKHSDRAIHVAALALVFVAIRAVPGFAQSTLHGFAGVGIVAGGDDTTLRAPAPSTDTAYSARVLDVGVWLSSRVGVGVEIFKPGDVAGSYFHGRVDSGGSETEQAIAGSGRVRVLRFAHAAVDVVAGVGSLRRTINTFSTDTTPPTPRTSKDTVHLSSATYLLGSDLTLDLAPHLALVPTVRVYRFERPNDDSRFDRSSTRRVWGALLRVTW